MTTPEGTIATRCRSTRPNGLVDALPLRFPLLSFGDVRLSVLKNPDTSLTIEVRGLHGRDFMFAEIPPSGDPNEVHVAVRWTGETVSLFLNGQRIKDIDLPKM